MEAVSANTMKVQRGLKCAKRIFVLNVFGLIDGILVTYYDHFIIKTMMLALWLQIVNRNPLCSNSRQGFPTLRKIVRRS
jgi:hypothetical protein